jgi:uncharacterized membrane protein YbhN (UPF0104 family)
MRVAIGLALLAAAGTLVSWASIFKLLRQTDAGYASTAVALLVPNLWLQHVKWLRLLHLIDPEIRKSDAAASLLAGFALGLVTPGRVGEIGRGFFLRNVDRVQATVLAGVDKLTTLAVIFLAGMAGVIWAVAGAAGGNAAWPAMTAGFLAGSALLAMLLAPGRVSVLLGRARLSRLRALGTRLQNGVWTGSTLRFRLVIVGLSLAFYITFVLQFSLFVAAFTGSVRPEYSLAAAVTLFTKSLLPISFGDLGVREGSAALVFARIGVPAAAAFNGALLLFVANVALPGIFGTILILVRRVRTNKHEA